jgi:hypothetical protein
MLGSTSRYRAWCRLSRQERWDFLSAVVATSFFATSLHTLGVRRTMSWMERRKRPRPPANEQAVVRDVVMAVGRTERYSPLGGTCLSRSLALQWLLARRGISTNLRLGGAIVNGHFGAHAWVEHDGVVVGSPPDVATRFATFVAAPATSPLSQSLHRRMPPP